MNFFSLSFFSSKKAQGLTLKLAIPALIIVVLIFILILYPRKTISKAELESCREKGGITCIPADGDCPSDNMAYAKKDNTDCISEGLRYCCVPIGLNIK